MLRDMSNNTKVSRAISPVSEGGNTALVSQIIDTKGYDSLMFAILTGSLGDAGAEFTTLVEHDDDSGLATAAAVDDADLNGTEAGASFDQADDNSVFKIGYVGGKRYVRLTITPANNATAALIAAVAIQGKAHVAPIDQ